VFVLAAVIFLLLLPSPWNLVAFIICLVLFPGEVAFWHRTVRGRKKVVGAQTLIGETGTTLSVCRPRGQARIGGETWAVRCEGGADMGDEVRVVDRDRLTLIVERVAASEP
jgi:membrane protein implicated in regulation of membrane protease activity